MVDPYLTVGTSPDRDARTPARNDPVLSTLDCDQNFYGGVIHLFGPAVNAPHDLWRRAHAGASLFGIVPAMPALIFRALIAQTGVAVVS